MPLPGVELQAGELLLPAEAAHHARVARVEPGDQVELLDLDGTVAQARLLRWEHKGCRVAVERIEKERGEPPAPVVLALGVLHTRTFDWAVEKATELGVTRIVPVLAARVQGRNHQARLARWQRIALAAVAQCGRSRAPQVVAPLPLADYLAGSVGLRLVADAAAPPLPGPLSAGGAGITVLVGPEGGFTPGEVAATYRAGFLGLPLGGRILRAETAAIAALAVAQDRLAWGGKKLEA
ncbi:MAG: RsmE family RNA methyltransferase [Acidobacteriota bacterium]